MNFDDSSSDSSASFRYPRKLDQTRKILEKSRYLVANDTDEKKEEDVVARTALSRQGIDPFLSSSATGRPRVRPDEASRQLETSSEEQQGGYVGLHELSSDLKYMESPGATEIAIPRDDDDYEYFQIKYKGIVSLLREPHTSAPRSGHYLSYGEVFACRKQSEQLDIPLKNPDKTPHRSIRTDFTERESPNESVSTLSSPTSSKDMIRVERILTGGYSIDAGSNAMETPLRENVAQMQGPSPVPENLRSPEEGSCLGYLLARSGNEYLIEKLDCRPQVEQGKFKYRVISTSPVPILTGPSLDAPKTRAVLLPNTIHEVSMKFCSESVNGVHFLRLSYRRGWIADHQILMRAKGAGKSYLPTVKEISNSIDESVDDGDRSVVSSMASTYLMTPSLAARKRHRPPRRLREGGSDKEIPRDVIGKMPSITPTKGAKQSGLDHHRTPSSNISILTNDSFTETNHSYLSAPVSPDVSYSTVRSGTSHHGRSDGPSWCYLMRVTAPNGLKILDAPQFQVNSLIHGKQHIPAGPSSMSVASDSSSKGTSIFQTMASRTSTTNIPGKSYVFDRTTKTRILPRGVLFEASKRMESTGAFSQGAGLIKLLDGSGWAIVPTADDLEQQYQSLATGTKITINRDNVMGFEEVGRAVIGENTKQSHRLPWMRIHARSGISVACPPPMPPLSDHPDLSPASSRGSSAHLHGSNAGAPSDTGASEVASSVGSGFLDAILRTPQKTRSEVVAEASSRMNQERSLRSTTLPCGLSFEVEHWEEEGSKAVPDFVRLKGGQGWVCTIRGGKDTVTETNNPEFRFGSFWFRVKCPSGIKVRPGPSRRAPSIKSEEGAHFRFECGEYLRASEIMTIFSDGGHPVESFAKLYRNRHVRLNESNQEYRALLSMTAAGEWVQIFHLDELYLKECDAQPRIERHKEGWRYNVLPEIGVEIRRGPSFAAEKTGITLLGGESVVINERVCPPGQQLTWLRIKDGDGWVHDLDEETGEPVMLAHSLRHRTTTAKKGSGDGKDEVAYNAIIARLFHNEGLKGGYHNSRLSKK